jgi:hypothetical protein
MLGIIAAITLAVVAVVRGQQSATAPAYVAAVLPSPPHQTDPWTAPPSTLPANLISATTRLFEQGLADPRGGEYRAVDLVVGNVWNGSETVSSTNAWVLPRRPGMDTDFAVSWSGLVYPVLAIRAPADLRADVTAMIRQDGASQYAPFGRLLNAFPEAAAVAHDEILPGRVCILLRLGEADLASRVWDQWIGGMKPQMDDTDAIRNDPYLELAREWAWAMFDRAVCAHMRGDHGLSLATARALAAASPLIETEAAKRGFARPRVLDPTNFNRELPNPPYLGFLQDLPALIADEQRRLDVGNVVRVLAHSQAYPEKSARIAALIRDLEEIEERQWGQPGSVNIAESKIIRALETEGDAAVEPLIDCFERDQRLTRSVGFGRDFHMGRNFIAVREAARVALSRILQMSSFDAASNASHAQRVADIRAFWAQNKDKTPAERWYAVLADDTAAPDQWIEAAMRIVRPVDVDVRGGWVNVVRRRTGEVPVLRGEALRPKTNPSVSELMARRVPQIVSSVQDDSSIVLFRCDDATRVALALNRWDRAGSIPALRDQLARARALLDRWSQYGAVSVAQHSRQIAQLSLALAQAGDQTVLAEYASWLGALKPDDIATNASEIFAPLWLFPDNQPLHDAADHLFNDAASAWRSFDLRRSGPSWATDALLNLPLVGTAPLRAHILRNLEDQTVIGTTKVVDRSLQLTTPLSTGGRSLMNANDPLIPPDGREIPLRTCDWYADALSLLDGTPQFEPYWPVEKRDAAIAALRSFFQQYGDRFAYSEQQRLIWEWADTPQARLAFEPLDHPATADDVKSGRAIFSLEPAPDRRLAPLENFPTRARWKTLKDFPITYETFNPQTKQTLRRSDYDQLGMVWQAEEIREGGVWKRYYGFVGKFIVAKVPADEIELLPGNDPTTRPQ